jgi:hypothetical protein
MARAAASRHSVIELLCDDLLADAPADDDIAVLAVHLAQPPTRLVSEYQPHTK